MLSIVRCCTRLTPRATALKSGLGGQSFYRSIPKTQTTIGAAPLGKGATRLFQVNGARRMTGTYALRFASAEAPKSRKLIGSWLLVCGGMVFVAVALGTAGYAIFYYYVRRAVKVVVDQTWGK